MMEPRPYWPLSDLEKASYARTQEEIAQRESTCGIVLDTLKELSATALEAVPVITLIDTVNTGHPELEDFETRTALSILARRNLVRRNRVMDEVTMVREATDMAT